MMARLVLQQAIDMENEERRAYFKGMQIAVQNGVAKAFGGGRG